MKTESKILNIWFVCIAVYAMLTSCEDDSITVQRGKSPDSGQLQNTYGMLRSVYEPTSVVSAALTEGGTYTDNLYFQMTRPLKNQLSMTVSADFSLVEAYNEEHGSSFTALPDANVSFAADRQGRADGIVS